MKIKICHRCKAELPILMFSVARDRHDGRKDNCIVCDSIIAKDYYKRNREKKLQYAKDHILEIRERVNRKRNENRDAFRAERREYDRLKMATSPEYKMRKRISGQIKNALKGGRKPDSTIKLLGYTARELVCHLEKQFSDGMSWNNHGEWHIDHRIPISSFDLTNEEEIKECWALTNLQPMWGKENIKKSNKILYLV